jgi:hypothetical protein
MLYSHLRLGPPSGLFPSGFLTKIFYAFLISRMWATRPPKQLSLIWWPYSYLIRIRISSVSTQTRLRAGRLGFSSRKGQWWDFSLRHPAQIGPGAHQASYPMGTEGSYIGVKRPGREADHSPPSSAEAKNAGTYTSTLQYVFMAWCLIKQFILLQGVVLS